MKQLTLGLVAHVDAGKTTLSEAILYRCGAIRNLGRVDHQDTFLDTDDQERARGITIFSKQAVVKTPDATVTLLDTPGHVDFSAEMERVLQVLDCAVLVISGTAGVQGHTHTLWNLLHRFQVPVVIFVNKMDVETADREQIFRQLQKELSECCVDFSQEEDALQEQLALCSEDMMEKFLETGSVEKNQVCELVRRRKLFPCVFGSALHQEGIERLMEVCGSYVLPMPTGKQFGARVFKISRDEKGARLTFLKVTGGTLQVKQLIETSDWSEKVDQIRLYSGTRYTLLQQAPAGTVCAVTGLEHTCVGQALGSAEHTLPPVLQPVLEYAMRLEDGGDEAAAYGQLRILEQEDPQLHLVWDNRVKQMRVQLMGPVQMEILQKRIESRFGLKIFFDEGRIVYKETIEDAVEGVGHYEPLRHYAEVHLLMEPGEPGSGLIFDTMCPTDSLNRSWQHLVLTHLGEKQHKGVLTGSPITDMRITLVCGKAHLKHTEGGDFRQATYRAVRQGLRKAKSVLLEPWYQFRLELPSANLGHALTDLSTMQAQVDAPENDGTTAVVTGSAPVRHLRSYQQTLTAYTKGRGRLLCQPDGYRPCTDQETVVRELGYDCERDLENPTGSVFCDHGAGFEVKWDQVDRMAHLPLLRFGDRAPEQPQQRFVRSVDTAASPELDRELLNIFERTYGAIRRRDVLPFLYMRSEDKREMLQTMEPAEEYLLVDGYNIIFAWDELKELAKESLDTARHVLMNLLCNYQGYRGCNLILVFDAYKVPENLGTVQKYHNIYLVYTRQAETADQYIERVSYELRTRKRVRVATSDSLEQLIILGHGAQRISARNFHDEVMQVQDQIENILKKNNQG